MRQPSLDQLLDLVGRVYDVALSPQSWDPLLEHATTLLDGTATVFFVQDRHAAGLAFSRLWGLPQAAMDEFERHFAPIDVGLDTLLAQPAGSIVTDQSTPAEVYRRSVIYNEFRRRWSSERYMACDVFRDPRRFGVLAVQGAHDRAAFGSIEATVLRRLLPHLRRAVQIRTQLHVADVRHRALEDVIDGLSVGVVMLDERAEVTYANAAARRIDGLQDGVRIVRGGLSATDASCNRALRGAIAAAIGTTRRATLDGGDVLIARRRSGARPFTLLVCPGPGADSHSPLRTASALVLIGDPDAAPESPAAIAAQLYGLTPAEARLACATAAGEGLERYAEEHGIALSTARWTMKQVLSKTGTRRQADLVRLILTGPAALVRPAVPTEIDGGES